MPCITPGTAAYLQPGDQNPRQGLSHPQYGTVQVEESMQGPPGFCMSCLYRNKLTQQKGQLTTPTNSRSLASLVLLPQTKARSHGRERLDINSIVGICQVLGYPLILGHPAFVSYPVTITVQLFFISLGRGGLASHFVGP